MRIAQFNKVIVLRKLLCKGTLPPPNHQIPEIELRKKR